MQQSSQQPPAQPGTTGDPAATEPPTRRWPRKQRRESLFGQVRDRGIMWIVRRFLDIQHRFGNYMNRRTSRWTRRHQRLFLVLFVLVFQSFCVAMLLWQPKRAAAPRIQSIQPATTVPPIFSAPPRLTGHDSIQIITFRRTLDSLMSTEAGRDTVAAFNRSHPGFIDSVLRLGEHYRLWP